MNNNDYSPINISNTEITIKYLIEFNQIHKIFNDSDFNKHLVHLIHNIFVDFRNFNKNKKDSKITYTIGISGSVASGKTYFANQMLNFLHQLLPTLNINLVSTDSFLLPNTELNKKGIMHQKGFPCSYDYVLLSKFFNTVKKEHPYSIELPMYSQETKDVVLNTNIFIKNLDILIVEGINVLEDYNDFSFPYFLNESIWLETSEENLKHWYEKRFFDLIEDAKKNSNGAFLRYITSSKNEIQADIDYRWNEINLKNYNDFIKPSSSLAKRHIYLNKNHSIYKIENNN